MASITPVASAKPWYTSKSIWAGIILTLTNTIAPTVLPPDTLGDATNIINTAAGPLVVLFRLITDRAVTKSK